MDSLLEGQLVTVAGKGAPVDGIVFDAPSALKVVVAVQDSQRGAVLRTVERKALSERAEEGPHDEALRRLIRRTPSTQRGGRAGGQGAGGGGRGHSRPPAHRTTGR
jgi:hypothetical protein